MPFTPLADRIADTVNVMCLLLCGPILRKVEKDSVTVWVVLKDEKKVWLEVYENLAGSGAIPNLKKILAGDRKTIRLGAHLYVVAVTAKLVDPQNQMAPGKLYYYNLFFTDINAATVSPTDTNLESNNITLFEIHYAHEPEDLDPDHSTHIHLPSFCLAPDDLNQLRIVHGSCRKAHAESLDALPGMDDMILSDRFSPDKRPHYLFLTGDQFYADDVSPIMLYMLMDAEKGLLGSKSDPRGLQASVEELPVIGKPELKSGSAPGNLLPLERLKLEEFGGYTSREKNHIATAGEYLGLYLFMWSDIIWKGGEDDDFPSFGEVGGSLSSYKSDLESLKKLYGGLSHVKRAMANIPTYMIFDDHDVTDDWYMTFDWCENVLSRELGRRLILNGLLTYAIFQDWGNKPEQYFEVSATGNGKLLLDAAVKWFAPGSKREDKTSTQDEEPNLKKFLGIPLNPNSLIKKPGTDFFMIDQGTDALRWDFVISRQNYEIKFLDGRTRRGYPDPAHAPRGKQSHPDIISETSLIEQFDHDNQNAPLKEVTMIIAPTSMVSIPAIELDEFPWFVSFMANLKFKSDVYEFDVYDHWRNQSKASEKLLSFLSKRNTPVPVTPGVKKESRVIILTGDVHFAAASRLFYDTPENKSLFAQLISSSFKKQEIKTRILHQRGYKFTNISALALGNAFLTKFVDAISGIPVVGPVLIIALIWPLILLQLTFIILDKLLQVLDQTILKNWFEPKGMESRLFLGWNDPAQQNIDHLFIPIGSPPNTLFKEVKLEKPAVVESKILEVAKEPKLKSPEWQYRIDFITAANDVRGPAPDPNPIQPLTAPVPGDRKEALKQYLVLARNHRNYAKKWGNGKEIVGLNNISEVFFEWSASNKNVRQETWWRLVGNDGEPLKLFPLSKFKVSLNFADPEYPITELH